jgi:hypothetical protein
MYIAWLKKKVGAIRQEGTMDRDKGLRMLSERGWLSATPLEFRKPSTVPDASPTCLTTPPATYCAKWSRLG